MKMYCKNCGSQIDDNAVVCPHCGVATSRMRVSDDYSDRSNTIAIVGFVLSFFISLAGLVCSIIGYKAAKNEGKDHGGLALAGIIISAISIGLCVLLFIIIFAAAGCVAATV